MANILQRMQCGFLARNILIDEDAVMKKLLLVLFYTLYATSANSGDMPPGVMVASFDEPTHCPAIFIETDNDGQAVKIELQDQWGYRTSNTPTEMTDNLVQMWYMRKIMKYQPTVYMNGAWIDGSPCNV
ncbi:MAG: hypothetical protein COC09_02520 [Gammaproteobacteria bacterium]|nr:hypothetical protein [Gammaproteobacteria bacterium]PCH64476.1 MAG: hypothetical protein COC09_02520 [Gammaproteobacteria bacterium]